MPTDDRSSQRDDTEEFRKNLVLIEKTLTNDGKQEVSSIDQKIGCE